MSCQKRPLAYLLGITENLGFAAGNVCLSINKYMRGEEYDILIYHASLNDQDRAALLKIPNVRLVPFSFEKSFADFLLVGLPQESRFRTASGLMCLCHFEAFALLAEYNTVVWLDADVAIQGNLAGIVDFKPFGITSDSPWSIDVNFTQPISGYDMTVPGWCTAVMAVHDSLPYEDMYKWCLDKTMEYAGVLINPDQGIINLALQHFQIRPSEMPLETWQCLPWRERAASARIVHFGTGRKVWSDPNVFAAFPEWHRIHLEWLQLGGRDFDRRRLRVRNPLEEFDKLDTLSGYGNRHWTAPNDSRGVARVRQSFFAFARRSYARLHFHDAPYGSVRNATHTLLRALLIRARVSLPPAPAVSTTRSNVAFRLRGGLGDHLIAARYIRDLSAAVGGIEYDLFSSRPEMARWIFQHIPQVRTIYNEHLEWEASYRQYSLPVHLQQYVYLYLDQADCRKALQSNKALGRICESIERNRELVAAHIVGQPHTDHMMALQAGLRGWNRYNMAHHMSELAYGGDVLTLDLDEGGAIRHDLTRGPYITIHNASDENFTIGTMRMGDRLSTKVYPHFARLVELIKKRYPELRIVHLGAGNSRQIAGVDLDLRGRCSIQETAAILSKAKLHIDVESGLVHLAACLGVKSCVLFGPTSLEYFGYESNINIAPAVCGNCWWLTPDWMLNCGKGHPVQKCLDETKPETVFRTLLPALEEIGAEASEAVGALAPMGILHTEHAD